MRATAPAMKATDVWEARNRIWGLKAALPADPTLFAEGFRYYCSDEGIAYEVVSGAWVPVYDSIFHHASDATLAQFQANAATGSMKDPDNINDNNTTNTAEGDVIGEYAEIVFPKWVNIDQWRQYGNNLNNEDGEFKIQYFGVDKAWHDWVTGIPTRKTNWGAMTPAAEIICVKVRIETVIVDTGANGTVITEIEVYHS